MPFVVQCVICGFKKTVRMSDETFRVLDMQNIETGQCLWSCKSCKSYAMKFDKRMRDVEKRVQGLEKKVPVMETDIVNMKDDIAKLKKTPDTLKIESKKTENLNAEDLTKSFFTEMRERQSRECTSLSIT